MVTIASPTFPELKFQRYSPASFLSYSPDNDKETEMNPIQESVNKVKCAAQGKRSERDGEVYGKSDMSMIII